MTNTRTGAGTVRSYHQNCPIALGLDVLGDRWTLLILREMVGGPRRYVDIRAELPGIATNLLAERLRELEAAGLVERTELPPPAARTVLGLTEAGWRYVVPVLQSVARLGLREWAAAKPDAVSPFSGFLAGVLLAFDPSAAGDLEEIVSAEIDGRRFEFAVSGQSLVPADGRATVTMAARAADLVAARLAAIPAEREGALSSVAFTGPADSVDRVRRAFHLTADGSFGSPG
jgi:DNA-binding HxlR family transcriptional regulator